MRRLFRDESGKTAVEYAVLLAVVLSVVAVAVTFLGKEMNAVSERNSNEINSALSQAEPPEGEVILADEQSTDRNSPMTVVNVVTFVAVATTSVAWLARRGLV